MKKFFMAFAILAGLFPAFADDNDHLFLYVYNSVTPVPEGWYAEYTKSPTLYIVYSPADSENDEFTENFNLTVTKINRDYKPEDVLKQALPEIKKVIKDFKLIDGKENYHIYEGYYGETLVKQMQYIYVKNKKVYTLTFSSTPSKFDDYSELFHSIAENITFVEE